MFFVTCVDPTVTESYNLVIEQGDNYMAHFEVNPLNEKVDLSLIFEGGNGYGPLEELRNGLKYSLSVGDRVALLLPGHTFYYRCDPVGWTDLNA